MAIRKLLPRIALSLLVLVVADQLALRLLLRGGTLFSYPVAPYDPPIFCESQERSLEAIRAALETGVADSSEAKRISINGREIEYRSAEDLLKLEAAFAVRVAMEENPGASIVRDTEFVRG